MPSVASYTESFRSMKSMSEEMFPAWFVGFAIDATAMICWLRAAATLLSEKINPSLTIIHCITHIRTSGPEHVVGLRHFHVSHIFTADVSKRIGKSNHLYCTIVLDYCRQKVGCGPIAAGVTKSTKRTMPSCQGTTKRAKCLNQKTNSVISSMH